MKFFNQLAQTREFRPPVDQAAFFFGQDEPPRRQEKPNRRLMVAGCLVLSLGVPGV
jgi:hypothetical protein